MSERKKRMFTLYELSQTENYDSSMLEEVIDVEEEEALRQAEEKAGNDNRRSL